MRTIVLCAAMCFVAPGASADEPRVALAAVVEQALAANPEIGAVRQRYEALLARPVQERSLMDPMVSAGYSAVGNPLPGAGLGVEPIANIGFMVSQEIPYPGKRGLRAAIASREAEAELQQVETTRLDVISRVTQAYYRLAYTYAVADVIAKNKVLLDTLLKVGEIRYSVGHAAQQDVIKAQMQLSILELRRQRITQERLIRTGELNAILNRPVGTPFDRPDDLAPAPFDASLDAVAVLAAERAPMLRRDRIMIDASQLAVDAARKEYRPDFVVSGGYAYMGAMPPMYEFRFDVRVPLQRQRRAAAVAERVSTLEAARSTYGSSRLAIEARLQEDYHTATTAARLAALYRDTVVPQGRLALESSIASYQTGTVDFLSVLTNFGSVLDFEMTYFDELATFHGAVARLEAMTGTALVH